MIFFFHFTQALNVETLLVEKVKAKEWSNEAIKSLRDFVANADELNFTCKWKNNGHQFGDLEVIVYADDYTISAANVLIDGGCAVLSKNFSKGKNFWEKKTFTIISS